MLTELEVKLCCLIFFTLSEKTIATILPYKEASIRPKVVKIKRKAGLNDLNEMYRKMLLSWDESKIEQINYLTKH